MSVEAVGVLRGEREPAETLQSRVRDNGADEGLAETVAAVRVEDEHIAEPGVGRIIGDDAHEADLRAGRSVVAEAEGIFKRTLDGFAGNAFGPVALLAQVGVNDSSVEPRRIVGEQIVAVAEFVRHDCGAGGNARR